MFGSKSRGQVITEELSEGMSHVRSAASEATKAAADILAPRVEAARDAVTPRVEAARDAMTPRVEAAKDALESRLVAARDQAEARRADLAELADQSRRTAKKTAKRAQKNAHKAKKVARGARKDAKSALAEAKAQARAAVGKEPKKRRRLPYFLLVGVGIIGVLIARSRSKSNDDDLWGARSDSPVPGYTEDPKPTVTDIGPNSLNSTPDPEPDRIEPATSSVADGSEPADPLQVAGGADPAASADPMDGDAPKHAASEDKGTDKGADKGSDKGSDKGAASKSADA